MISRFSQKLLNNTVCNQFLAYRHHCRLQGCHSRGQIPGSPAVSASCSKAQMTRLSIAGLILIEMKIFMAGSTRLRYFAALTQGKHGSTRLKHFTAQLLRLRLRLPGLFVTVRVFILFYLFYFLNFLFFIFTG